MQATLSPSALSTRGEYPFTKSLPRLPRRLTAVHSLSPISAPTPISPISLEPRLSYLPPAFQTLFWKTQVNLISFVSLTTSAREESLCSRVFGLRPLLVVSPCCYYYCCCFVIPRLKPTLSCMQSKSSTRQVFFPFLVLSLRILCAPC